MILSICKDLELLPDMVQGAMVLEHVRTASRSPQLFVDELPGGTQAYLFPADAIQLFLDFQTNRQTQARQASRRGIGGLDDGADKKAQTIRCAHKDAVRREGAVKEPQVLRRKQMSKYLPSVNSPLF